MCGIIGYVGSREAHGLLLQGLERLEYRGYDSAGICLLEDDGLDYVRAVGNLDQLKAATASNGSDVRHRSRPHALGDARQGLVENAHPLTGCVEDEVAVVLNGIVENFRELQARRCSPRGTNSRPRRMPRWSPTWSSATTRATSSRPCKATYKQLEGHFAFVVVHRDHPDLLVGARLQCPLVVGVGEGRCSSPRPSPRSCARRTACS